MNATHDFLALLGLGEDARERDIRSAYARRLKRIDQDLEPGAFQQLRDAYETALDWAAWKVNQAGGEQAPVTVEVRRTPAPAPLPVPAPAPSGHAATDTPAADIPVETNSEPVAALMSDDPHALAHAVFARLAADLEVLATTPGDDDARFWKSALRRRLDDAELFNIDARIVFEAMVAGVLAHGWRPGHESLFVAARHVFAWDGDRRRVRQFGQAGALLDAAIDEQGLFAALEPSEQQAMQRAARALREPAPPGTRELRALMRNIESMMARFPALMQVSVSLDNVEHWRARYRELFGAAAGEPIQVVGDLPPPPPPLHQRLFSWMRGGMAIFFVVMVLGYLLDSGSKSSRYSEQELRQTMRLLEQDAAYGQLVRKHTEPVRFTPSAGAKAGPLGTRVRVFLDADGKVERTQNLATSGEPAFDLAVARVLASATPFPPETPRQFDVSFSTTIEAADLERARQSQAKAPDAADLDRHVPPIAWQPTRFSREGNLTLRYAVFLDAAGRVDRIEQRESSGEPRLDHTFEDALRAAKPFPAEFARSFDVSWSTTVTRKPAPAPSRGDREG